MKTISLGYGIGAVVLSATVLSGCDDNFERRDSSSANIAVGDNIGTSTAGGTVHVFGNGFSALSPDASTVTGSNENIAFDASGTLYRAGDSDSSVRGITAMCGYSERTTLGFNTARDRTINLAGTGIKGLVHAQAAGVLIASDTTASMNIQTYSASAPDGAAALGTLATTGSPWDAFYDEENDRLFVGLTNGQVDVIDDFTADGTYTGPVDRTIIPVDFDGNPFAAPTNIHGVVVKNDVMVLADVGSGGVADDGSIYVIANAAAADGNAMVQRIIEGDQTELGNPVDIVLSKNGSSLIVAEKAQNRLLTFNNIFAVKTAPENRPANTSIEFTAAETVAQLVEVPSKLKDSSDLAGEEIAGVIVSTNPSADVGLVEFFSTGLAGAGTFNAGDDTDTRLLESIVLDINGNGVIGFDDGAGVGGLLIANRIYNRAGSSDDTVSTDRIIAGASTGLVSPKGLEVATTESAVIVADQGAGDIKVFSLCSEGDVAPLFTVTDVGAANIWDTDYDASTDRLFVAGTNGSVLVYDDFFAKGKSATVSRTITPAVDGTQISSNIHGIIHVASSNKLILTDVGAVTSGPNDDGAIFVINRAATADGMVTPAVNIGDGDTTSNTASNDGLGNPVDITFDGKNLYVAEKTKDRLYRFDNILSSASGAVTPDGSISVTKPESVVLVPSRMADSF